jgi:hypothetical protein
MTTLATTHPTLLDVSKRMGADGKIQKKIIEILDQRNEILDDVVWVEANEYTGHLTTIRSGIPEPSFRKLYGGVQPQKSRTVQVREAMGMLESYAEIDKALADFNGNTAEWRMSEETPFIQGFNRKVAKYLFLGNELTEPEGFTGLAPRFNDQSAENGGQIITDAATPDNSDNSSIWLVVWGPDTVCGIYPKGSKAGLQMTDKGQQTKENSDGSMLEVYRSHYRWDAGLCVRDWRYVSRGQVDAEDLTKTGSTGPDLMDIMAQMIEQIEDLNAGRAAFYCNRKIRGFIRRQIMNKTVNSSLTIEQLTRANGALIRTPMFDGIPIRTVDQLTNTETGI